MVTAEIWPTLDYSRVPYRLYHAEIYKQEQDRIFKGPTWNYLCLDAEMDAHGRRSDEITDRRSIRRTQMPR
jgi:hypothetical protein